MAVAVAHKNACMGDAECSVHVGQEGLPTLSLGSRWRTVEGFRPDRHQVVVPAVGNNVAPEDVENPEPVCDFIDMHFQAASRVDADRLIATPTPGGETVPSTPVRVYEVARWAEGVLIDKADTTDVSGDIQSCWAGISRVELARLAQVQLMRSLRQLPTVTQVQEVAV
jgi:hypothetical protein